MQDEPEIQSIVQNPNSFFHGYIHQQQMEATSDQLTWINHLSLKSYEQLAPTIVEILIKRSEQMMNNQKMRTLENFQRVSLFLHFIRNYPNIIEKLMYDFANQTQKGLFKMLIFYQMARSVNITGKKAKQMKSVEEFDRKYQKLILIPRQNHRKLDQLVGELETIFHHLVKEPNLTVEEKQEYRCQFKNLKACFSIMKENQGNNVMQFNQNPTIYLEDIQWQDQSKLQQLFTQQNISSQKYLAYGNEANLKTPNIIVYPTKKDIANSIPEICQQMYDLASNQGGQLWFDYQQKTQQIHLVIGRNMSRRAQKQLQNSISKDIKTLGKTNNSRVPYNISFLKVKYLSQNQFMEGRFCCKIRVGSLIQKASQLSKQEIRMLTDMDCQLHQTFINDTDNDEEKEKDSVKNLEFDYLDIYTCNTQNNQEAIQALQDKAKIKILTNEWNLNFNNQTALIFSNVSKEQLLKQVNFGEGCLAKVSKKLEIKGVLTNQIKKQLAESVQKQFPYQSFQLYRNNVTKRVFLLGFSTSLTLFMYQLISIKYRNILKASFYHGKQMKQQIQTFYNSFSEQQPSEQNVCFFNSIRQTSKLFIKTTDQSWSLGSSGIETDNN